MAPSKTPGDKRGQHVALLGGVLQLAAFGLVLVLSFAGDSPLLAALARFVVLGVPIWFCIYFILNQVRRVGMELLETEELRRAREAGGSQGIFGLDDEALLLEQNRLRWMVRWLLPGGAVFVSLSLILGHFVGWGWRLDEVFNKSAVPGTEHPTVMMWAVIGVALVCFLHAKYALALARTRQWVMLRAGAVCMAGASLAAVMTAIALMATLTIEWAEPVAVYILRVALLLLGIEFAVNFVLDLYRPRVPGEVPRPSFDSRLLGMVAEPGAIAKSIADAINYQFGFQVSSTWFYQLLQRALFPITVFAFLCILLLTSIVVVDADERAVIERFGRRVGDSADVLTPGFYLKWPYPVDIVRRAPVARVDELIIGEAVGRDAGNEAIVWTDEHESLPHLMLVVATPHRDQLSARRGEPSDAEEAHVTESVAVSLLMVSVPIEYRVKDLAKFLYHYADPKKILEVVAYQYVSDYAASVDVDELMGPGREMFNREFRRRLQERLDELDTGIEIAFVGLRAAHPTSKRNVAAAFERVVASQTEMAAMIRRADGEAQRILTAAAGSAARADELDDAIRLRDGLVPNSPEWKSASRRVEALLLGDPEAGLAAVSGQSAQLIAEARARSSRMTADAATKARVFETEVAAFAAAPTLYRERRMLDIYAGLNAVRKYLIVGDRSNVIVEYETAKEAGLDEVLSEGVSKEMSGGGS